MINKHQTWVFRFRAMQKSIIEYSRVTNQKEVAFTFLVAILFFAHLRVNRNIIFNVLVSNV